MALHWCTPVPACRFNAVAGKGKNVRFAAQFAELARLSRASQQSPAAVPSTNQQSNTRLRNSDAERLRTQHTDEADDMELHNPNLKISRLSFSSLRYRGGPPTENYVFLLKVRPGICLAACNCRMSTWRSMSEVCYSQSYIGRSRSAQQY